jgi:uncharacterized protein (DUF1810 family)
MAAGEDEFEHFVRAQAPVYEAVVAELQAGEKQTHWMWFIFPQLEGLGHSHMAQRFALHSLDEARRYAQHPQLGERLRHCTRLVVQIEERSVSEIFGYPDDLKFHSCMTLFHLAIPDDPLFKLALDKYFDGKKGAKTMELLKEC